MSKVMVCTPRNNRARRRGHQEYSRATTRAHETQVTRVSGTTKVLPPHHATEMVHERRGAGSGFTKAQAVGRFTVFDSPTSWHAYPRVSGEDYTPSHDYGSWGKPFASHYCKGEVRVECVLVCGETSWGSEMWNKHGPSSLFNRSRSKWPLFPTTAVVATGSVRSTTCPWEKEARVDPRGSK